MKFPWMEFDISQFIAVLLVTDLLLHVVQQRQSTCLASRIQVDDDTDDREDVDSGRHHQATTRRRGGTPVAASSHRDCQPVPHDVLWQKLDLPPSGHGLHRRSARSKTSKSIQTFDDFDEVARGLQFDAGDHFLDSNSNDDDEEEEEVLKDRRRARRDARFYSAVRRRRRSTGSPDDEHDSFSAGKDELHSDERMSVDAQSTKSNRRRIRGIVRHGIGSSTSSNSTSRRLRQLRKHLSAPDAVAVHQCQLKTQWRKMSDKVFPPYLEVGRCVQTTCMMGLYECSPRRYAVKILRRLPRRCNPLPTVGGNSTTYEHAWYFDEFQVTVGCECGRRRRAGRVEPPMTEAVTASEDGRSRGQLT